MSKNKSLCAAFCAILVLEFGILFTDTGNYIITNYVNLKSNFMKYECMESTYYIF